MLRRKLPRDCQCIQGFHWPTGLMLASGQVDVVVRATLCRDGLLEASCCPTWRASDAPDSPAAEASVGYRPERALDGAHLHGLGASRGAVHADAIEAVDT